VVGESGCGKSTLAKLIIGLEKPTSGEILVQGQNLAKLGGDKLRRARRNIQLVMQDPYTSLNPRMTVGDIIGEPFQIHPEVAPRDDRRRRVKELLDLVGLNPDHINRYPHQFSGGQRQRIGIARAVALRPEIIVYDEPVSALDLSIQAQVINLMERLQEELGLAYIFIAHDLSVVRHISDRVAVMYLGKIIETGADAEIYDNPTHPYTQALLSAVPVPDPMLRGLRDQIILEGNVPSPGESTERMPVPYPLLEGAGHLCPAGAGAGRAGRFDASERLPLRRRAQCGRRGRLRRPEPCRPVSKREALDLVTPGRRLLSGCSEANPLTHFGRFPGR
jgi:oligopeptide transport system ATP-binding protein